MLKVQEAQSTPNILKKRIREKNILRKNHGIIVKIKGISDLM
jgi:hypothetical protein